MTNVQKTVLNVLGGAVVIVALGFLALRFRDTVSQGELSVLGFREFGAVIGLGLTYGLANFTLCEGFHQLAISQKSGLNRRQSWRIFGISQIGKYVPGNIFHLAGRQALGGASGVGQMKLAKISLYELTGLALAASAFGFLFIGASGAEWLQPLATLPPVLGIAGFVGLNATIYFVLRHRFDPAIAKAYVLYALFFGATGLIFVALLYQFGGYSPGGLQSLMAAYVVSWLLGFVTPGAPAGLGVRDAALLLLIGASSSSAVMIVAVVASRVVNVIGDLATFLAALLLRRQRDRA